MISIYGDMSLHIHVLKDGYERSVIFTTLFLLKYICMYILLTAWHKLR
jgi:hypothetical protein